MNRWWLMVALVVALACSKAQSTTPDGDDADRSGDRDKAKKKKKRKLCSKNEKEAIVLVNQGDLIVDLDPNGAIEKYELATQLAPANHRMFYKLAKAYAKKEKWDKVASTLARATDIAPTFANYWRMRGDALLRQAKAGKIPYEDSVDSLRKCIEADPNIAACHAALGEAYVGSGELQEALQSFSKAVEADPTRALRYERLAALYIEVGFLDEAEEVLRAAELMATNKKQLAPCKHMLGDLLLEKGDAKAAQAAYREAKSSNPERAQYLFSMGRAHHELNQKQFAKDMLKGFSARACRGKKSQERYRTKCSVATAWIAQHTRVGG